MPHGRNLEEPQPTAQGMEARGIEGKGKAEQEELGGGKEVI